MKSFIYYKHLTDILSEYKDCAISLREAGEYIREAYGWVYDAVEDMAIVLHFTRKDLQIFTHMALRASR